MIQQTAFGRRGVEPLSITPATSRRIVAAIPDSGAGPLSPAAEAFHAGLVLERGREPDGFKGWRRSQRGGLLLIVLVRLTFLAPGAVTSALHAPVLMSISFEALGIAAGAWLQRQRRRRRAAIITWSEPDVL